MKKRIVSIILLLAFSAIAFNACAEKQLDFVNKTYIYEKFGLGGAFTITINADGTFTYSEGGETSYVANGSWSYDKGTLTLDDQLGEEFNLINNFKVQDGALVFVAEGSSNFIGIKVADGERFLAISE